MIARPLAASLVLAALAGCVSPSTTVDTNTAEPELVPEAGSLWPDHQNQPHPAYGWPTLTHPATGANVPAWWAPIPNATLPATIKGIAPAAKAPDEVESGGGIALFGSLAYVPTGFGSGSASVLDISNPIEPKLLSQVEGSGGRGAAIIAYPDGRLVAVASTSAGFDVVDITDPTQPEVVAQVKPPTGGHKVGVVPGTPIVYNANSAGGSRTGLDPTGNVAALAVGQTEIYDLTNPEEPQLVQEFKNGYGCHQIYFWISEEKQRATCAGIEYTQIWDIADPLDPKVIVNVPVHHGVADTPSASVFLTAFSHFAILNEDATILIVGDEMGGGSVPPGCTVPGAPTGALWFYDVKDETNPKLLGWFSPGTHLPKNGAASCTAHHGRLVPDPEGKRQLLAMAFYGAGTVLVDFTNPAMPSVVDQWNDGTNTWETWYYNGYLFTGDLNRGLDVLTFE